MSREQEGLAFQAAAQLERAGDLLLSEVIGPCQYRNIEQRLLSLANDLQSLKFAQAHRTMLEMGELCDEWEGTINVEV